MYRIYEEEINRLAGLHFFIFCTTGGSNKIKPRRCRTFFVTQKRISTEHTFFQSTSLDTQRNGILCLVSWTRQSSTNPGAEFMDKIQTKVLKSFPPCYSQLPLHCLEISISSNSRNLLQLLKFSYCVRCKGERRKTL
jgi:hypothetical protein